MPLNILLKCQLGIFCQKETVQVRPIEWPLYPMLAAYFLSAFMMSELKRGDTRDAGVIAQSDLDVPGM